MQLCIFLVFALLVAAQAFTVVSPVAKRAFVLSAKAKADAVAEEPVVTKKPVVGKAELIDKIKDKTQMKKKDIEVMLGAFLETVKEEVLDAGNEIRVRDFGTFKQKIGAPRTGRNPRTGEELQILGSKSVSFSAAPALKIKDEK